MSEKRPYVVVGAFVLGMLLTPPDIISQTLLALPMWVLFELGLLFCRWYLPVGAAATAKAKDGRLPPSDRQTRRPARLTLTPVAPVGPRAAGPQWTGPIGTGLRRRAVRAAGRTRG